MVEDMWAGSNLIRISVMYQLDGFYGFGLYSGNYCISFSFFYQGDHGGGKQPGCQ